MRKKDPLKRFFLQESAVLPVLKFSLLFMIPALKLPYDFLSENFRVCVALQSVVDPDISRILEYQLMNEG